MELRISAGRVLCKKEETEEVSDGGIFIPEVSLDAMKADHAEVLQTGEGVKGIEKGDVVYFTKYSGAELEIDEVDYVVLDAKEVLVNVRR